MHKQPIDTRMQVDNLNSISDGKRIKIYIKIFKITKVPKLHRLNQRPFSSKTWLIHSVPQLHTSCQQLMVKRGNKSKRAKRGINICLYRKEVVQISSTHIFKTFIHIIRTLESTMTRQKENYDNWRSSPQANETSWNLELNSLHVPACKQILQDS
jgi:hypothetical protein